MLRRLERLPLHLRRGGELLEGLDRARLDSGGWRRRRLCKDERNGARILVADEATLQKQIDEAGRFRRAADLPVCLAAPASTKRRAHLFDDLRDFVSVKVLPLDRVPGLAKPNVEGVALGLDPLLTWPERAEGIRVFGDLAQHRREANPPDGSMRRWHRRQARVECRLLRERRQKASQRGQRGGDC